MNDVLSLSSGVITDESPQNGTSCTVNATPQRMYVTSAHTNAAVEPSSKGAENNAIVVNAIGTGENKRYGRILPHFDFVLSTIIPITGSLSASKILPIRIIVVPCLSVKPAPFWKNTRVNIDISVYMPERPNAPTVKQMRSFIVKYFFCSIKSSSL